MEPNSTLVTLDVKNLYSSIPHELGYEALKYWLTKYPEDLHIRFSINFVLDSAKLILENNILQFNNNFYKQIKGTAMGTKFAPNYATLTLGFLEIKMYTLIEQIHGNTSIYLKSHFKRFLDDCFIIWPEELFPIEDFFQILNGLNEHIQFTKSEDKSEIPFLDILVKIKDNVIITDLYIKPTDTQQFLDYRSCHPRHTRHNVPFNLARRICTIVSDTELRDTALKELHHTLLQRNYPTQLISHAINKAKEIEVQELRRTSVKTPTKALIVVTTYNPNNPDFIHLARPVLPILYDEGKFGTRLREEGLLHSKRQPPNLKRLLTKAKFGTNPDTFTVTKCNNKRCKCCNHLLTGPTTTIGQHTFKAGCSMTCITSNLIYVLKCANCELFYIGETGDRLVDRVRVHRQQSKIGSTIELPVHKHFKSCTKDSDLKFYIFPFYKMPVNASKLQRLNMELHFINKFAPTLNQ